MISVETVIRILLFVVNHSLVFERCSSDPFYPSPLPTSLFIRSSSGPAFEFDSRITIILCTSSHNVEHKSQRVQLVYYCY